VRRSRRYKEIRARVKPYTYYGLDEAITILRENANARFDETVEVSIKLGVDPRRQDQLVRGAARLPYGTGKPVRVLCITRGEKEAEARAAGADWVGFDEYLERIRSGWVDFDYLVATPDAMPELSKLGKILGPRGLMPSPKTNTVTFDLGSVIRELKGGRVNFRADKTGNINLPVGKVSFEPEPLKSNILALLAEILRLRPAQAKGQYLKSVSLSSTMGPGLRLNLKEVLDRARGEA
jgi:large subunit ribosomal protein L1